MGIIVPMTRTFQEAFRAALTKSGVSLAEIARSTGISTGQLKQLKNRDGASTNVDDALLIVGFFGVSLPEFLDDPELSRPVEIVRLYNQLEPHLRARLAAFGEGLLAASDPSVPPKPTRPSR